MSIFSQKGNNSWNVMGHTMTIDKFVGTFQNEKQHIKWSKKFLSVVVKFTLYIFTISQPKYLPLEWIYIFITIFNQASKEILNETPQN